MEIDVSSDKENLLLGRREVKCIFRGSYGHFSRIDAVQALSKKIKITNKKVYVVSIDGKSGSRDGKGLFYIYDNENNAKKDISEYILTRNNPTITKPEKSTTPSKGIGEAQTKPPIEGEIKPPVVEAKKPQEKESEEKPVTESPRELQDEKINSQENPEELPKETKA